MKHQLFSILEAKDFVLASTSPRRKEILQSLGFNFRVVGSEFAEDLDKSNYTPEQYVSETAKLKAIDVWSRQPSKPDLLLSADTVIVANGQIYEKPVNKTIQLENLRKFVAEHTDIYAKTAVVVFIPAGETYQMLSHLESTKLQLDFANLTDGFLQLYVDSEEGLNAAGGFQIQGKGGLLFSKIDGDYSNVVGLPFASTFRLIERAVYNQE